ncbi:hypothetical protein AA15669_1182 [Saccharibacter floricola DSM 15669]|uniref:Uncharacterized protein n=2 Tax=Saccharibacter TaxID=231052 RepID=A0ABQ0NYZ3_9PROT|nr:hypothetical protein AA15669_1182 [Saccharibacter floricola DSM 15669]
MDTCDDIMKDHFAIDRRINGLLEHWGFKETSYKKKENILRALAKILDVDSWALDRLLYDKASALNPKKAPPRSTHGCRHTASTKKQKKHTS